MITTVIVSLLIVVTLGFLTHLLLNAIKNRKKS